MSIQADGSGNKKVQTTATGDAAATGMPKSIAPTRRAAPDEVTSVRAPSRAGYGMNNYPGASSLTPGQSMRSPLGDNMADTVNDPVLDAIVQHGSAAMRAPETGDDVETVRGTPATQLRKLAPDNVPDSWGMERARSRQPSYPGPAASVPASLDKSGDASQPVRKPS